MKREEEEEKDCWGAHEYTVFLFVTGNRSDTLCFLKVFFSLLLKSAHDRQAWLIKITTTTTTKKLSVFLQAFS